MAGAGIVAGVLPGGKALVKGSGKVLGVGAKTASSATEIAAEATSKGLGKSADNVASEVAS